MQTKTGGQKEIIVNGELIIDDEQFRINNNSVTMMKFLEQLNENKTFQWYFDFINSALTGVLLIIYIIRTHMMCVFDTDPVWLYMSDPEDEQSYIYAPCPADQQGQAQGWYTMLLIISYSYFLIDFIFRILVHKYPQKFFVTFDSQVEILTTVPILIIYIFKGSQNSEFKFLITLNHLRLHLYRRQTKHISTENKKEMVELFFKMISNLIFFTLLLQHLENAHLYSKNIIMSNASFFDYLFFNLITLSMVGYGSSLEAIQSKLLIVIIICGINFQLPGQISRFSTLFNTKSRYAKLEYSKLKDVPHIILIGSVTMSSLTNFLEEYLHEDHESRIRHCILMMPQRPDPATELLMMKPQYINALFYIEGSTLDNMALSRAKLEKSAAVIILSNKFTYDAENEDTKTILEAMIIKKYVNQERKKNLDYENRMKKTSTWMTYFSNIQVEQIDTKVCMQLLRHESITHYELSLGKEETKNDQIICIESLKLSMLSKSCLCPGFVVLVTNLIKSSSDPAPELENKKEDPNFTWLYEYWNGKCFEIYRIPIPECKLGLRFSDIASDVYKDSNLLLFAIEVQVNDKPNGQILLNPGNYTLPRKPMSDKNKFEFFGYVIANDKDTAEKAFTKYELNDAGGDESNGGDDIDKKQVTNDYYQNDQADNFNNDLDNVDADWRKIIANPVGREDIIFDTMEESMLADGHIIICGLVENIKHFVMPLRARYMKDPLPIVILHDELPSNKQWQQLQFFEQIYFVQGSPLAEKSYDRVNLMRAKQVVILTPNIQHHQDESKNKQDDDDDDDKSEENYEEAQEKAYEEENLLDAKTIFKYNIIKSKYPKVNVVTELINHENIAFLLDNPLMFPFFKHYIYDQTPVFACGEVYLSSLMDSLICQAYYNSALINVLKMLLIGDSNKNLQKDNANRWSQQDHDFSNVPTSNLFHVKVPKYYHGKRYEKLFDNLTTRRQMIPIGLYRTTSVNLAAFKNIDSNKKSPIVIQNEEKIMKEIKYVVTNPSKNTKLEENDLVFVLSKEEPGDPETWDDYNEKNKLMFDHNQNRIMSAINDMQTLPMKSKKSKKQNGSGLQKGQLNSGNMAIGDQVHQKNNSFQTMNNLQFNHVQEDDGEQVNLQADIHQSIGSKKMQDEFEQNVADLTKRIQVITDKTVELNRLFNRRNNSIVNDVTQIIHQVLTDSKSISNDMSDIQQSFPNKAKENNFMDKKQSK